MEHAISRSLGKVFQALCEARGIPMPSDDSSTSFEEHLAYASTIFNAKTILDHVEKIEPDRAVLKKEIKAIMKMHMSQLEQAGDVPRILKYLMLCAKYKIKETEMCGADDISFGNLIWTFPDFCFYQLKKHPQFKFPWSGLLMKDFPTFKVIYHNPGLLGMLPKGQKYGGLAKALVYLAYVVSVRVKDIDICVAISLAVYNSSLASEERRVQWFPNLEITEDDCAKWSEIFNRKFPNHTDIHKHFGQIA